MSKVEEVLKDIEEHISMIVPAALNLMGTDTFETLTDDERWAVSAVIDAHTLAETVAGLTDTSVDDLVLDIIKAIPIEAIAKLLSSFRTLTVKIAKGAAVVTPGVRVVVWPEPGEA